MPRTVLAFNGDLESRLALHWMVHERGYDVRTLSVNLGQEVYMEELAELALELGASAAQVLDRRAAFLHDFALPVLRANAVYQSGCFLGSALGRYVIAQELVHMAHEEGCTSVAHSAASKGNDQVRMEVAIAAQDPGLEILAPVRDWNLRSLEDKLNYARRRRLPIEEPHGRAVTVDRNLWGVSLYLDDLVDSWDAPPSDIFVLTRDPEQAPDTPAILTIGFENGVPCSLNGNRLELLPLVRELNQIGGEHAIGRSDVVEDRLFGIKSREFYEVPAPTILLAAHRDLESLVQSRELIALKESLSRRYAELVYMGLWFHDLRQSLDGFFAQTQRYVTGEVRLKLYKGSCTVLGRRSPYSVYDSRLASQSNLEWFDSQWAQGFTSLWTLRSRLFARRQVKERGSPGGWAAP
ncbi:MAG: argininosuccinate synthase [Gemmataceae bacterium]|nr:argininosuccinate synthase [Gemmataceae bacterium]MDW8265725.1 argininosuccinate synthase [Gemmataceae bacterium]